MMTRPVHCTDVRFASFFSGGFITAIVENPPERRLAKRTSVHWSGNHLEILAVSSLSLCKAHPLTPLPAQLCPALCGPSPTPVIEKGMLLIIFLNPLWYP